VADQTGRVFLITGANTGIGKATAQHIAALGGRLVLAARSEAKTQPVVDEINAAHGHGTAAYLHLDLADLASVRSAVDNYGGPVHVLINNAGVGGQRGETKDGFEIQFGVNHLGHFLLTTLLLDRLKDSPPSRVVTVSSTAHFQARGIDYEKVRGPTRSLTGLPEYAVSKLCNVLFSEELARRLADTGVTTYSLHPGAIASDIWRRIPQPFRLLTKLMKSPEQGAATSVYCATAPELDGATGRYYDDCREKPARGVATPELARELWRRSEDFVG
jgi:retinol dehydrogenase-12